MFDLVLFQPQIPPNTGNIIRLCANTGARLHLIEPLGFQLDEKSCRRAGLDYHALADINLWPDFDSFAEQGCRGQIWAVTKFGSTIYTQARFAACDTLLFGAETAGLPEQLRARIPAKRQIFLPMTAGSRSLNLSNAAAVILFEAWHQTGFSLD